jgi:predicted TPR repeat methyltransferase
MREIRPDLIQAHADRRFRSEYDYALFEYYRSAKVFAFLEKADFQVGGHVLDAGCGTGLCGPLIAPYARRLTGVDLSARMLDQARARNVYDELVKGELTAFLCGARAEYDVIVSADTLCYFGPLHDVTAAAAAALRPGGQVVFTVEELIAGGAESGYSLSARGRYQHAHQYVERVLAAAHLRSAIASAELRLESGEPVPGLVVRATKPTGAE